MTPIRALHCAAILTEQGWVDDSVVELDSTGCLLAIRPRNNADSAQQMSDKLGWVIPSFLNAHSHAFQFLMAGAAEMSSGTQQIDDFWSWRDLMYRCCQMLQPTDLKIAAEWVFREMLRAGYHEVHEFHYLYNDVDGKPYDDPLTLPTAVIEAALAAGIRMKFCPVFYQTSDIGKQANSLQRRFILSSAELYIDQLNQLATKYNSHSRISFGAGVHSLRAASIEQIEHIKDFARAKQLEFHIHIAEQVAEVNRVQSFYGKRPVELLAKHQLLDDNTWLIHATHTNDEEIESIVNHRAVVVLCPTTEADLGDGIFSFSKLSRAGGRWAIGSDSHIRLDPWDELRLIDQQHRLLSRKRMSICGPHQEAADVLLGPSLFGNRNARTSGGIQIGRPFDAIEIDDKALIGDGISPPKRLSRLMAVIDASKIRNRFVSGQIRSSDQEHRQWLLDHQTSISALLRPIFSGQSL